MRSETRSRIRLSVMVYTCELLAASIPEISCLGKASCRYVPVRTSSQLQAQERRRRPQPRTCASHVAHQDTLKVSATVLLFLVRSETRTRCNFLADGVVYTCNCWRRPLFPRSAARGESAAGTYQCALHSQPLAHAERYTVEVAVIKLASSVETAVTKLVSGVPWNAGCEAKDGAVEVPLARLKPNTHALLSAYDSASSLEMIRALLPESPRELHT